MKISWKRKLKRIGIQTLGVLLSVGALWGAGRIEPSFLEKTRDALSTSTDINRVMEKADDARNWVKSFGESGDD